MAVFILKFTESAWRSTVILALGENLFQQLMKPEHMPDEKLCYHFQLIKKINIKSLTEAVFIKYCVSHHPGSDCQLKQQPGHYYILATKNLDAEIFLGNLFYQCLKQYNWMKSIKWKLLVFAYEWVLGENILKDQFVSKQNIFVATRCFKMSGDSMRCARFVLKAACIWKERCMRNWGQATLPGWRINHLSWNPSIWRIIIFHKSWAASLGFLLSLLRRKNEFSSIEKWQIDSSED